LKDRAFARRTTLLIFDCSSPAFPSDPRRWHQSWH
jgi:hypothetical protein